MHSPKPTVARQSRRRAAPRIILATAAATGTAVLAYAIKPESPFPLDCAVREAVQTRLPRHTRTVLSPIFPLGLPVSYIVAAYGTARWLSQRRRVGGPAVVTAAWLGWLVHGGMKVFYRRERPPIPGVRRRMDSYPSGHTTGITALAVTTALVLRDQRLVPLRKALAIGIGAPLVMGAYRVVDDEHWITDVFGGWMLGSSIAFTCAAALGSSPPLRIRLARATPGARATRG